MLAPEVLGQSRGVVALANGVAAEHPEDRREALAFRQIEVGHVSYSM